MYPPNMVALCLLRPGRDQSSALYPSTHALAYPHNGYCHIGIFLPLLCTGECTPSYHCLTGHELQTTLRHLFVLLAYSYGAARVVTQSFVSVEPFRSSFTSEVLPCLLTQRIHIGLSRKIYPTNTSFPAFI